MATDDVQITLDSGIKPLETNYYQVKTTSRREFAGFYSEFVINSVQLGVLTPSQYRNVASRTTQCEKLFASSLNAVASELPLLVTKYNPEFLIMELPCRVFLKGLCEKQLEEITENGFKYSNLLYFTLSPDVLVADTQTVINKMKEMRDKFGVKFMLSSYADPYCPTMRIETIPFNGVMLDESVNNEDSLNLVSVQSALRLAGGLKTTCFMNKGEEDSLINKGFSSGCSLYIRTESKTFKELIEE